MAAPERRDGRRADNVLALRQPVGSRGEDEFRLPVRAVLRQPRYGVADLRIGETPRDEIVIIVEVCIGNRRHDRDEIILLELLEDGPDQRLPPLGTASGRERGVSPYSHRWAP